MGSKSINLDKRSKILLGVLAVVIVAAGAFFLLKGNGSSDSGANGTVTVPSAGAASPGAAVTPKVTVTPKASPKVPAPSASVPGTSTRDPFAPLPEESTAAASASPSAAASVAPSASASPYVTPSP